jgi:hypothetical protein
MQATGALTNDVMMSHARHHLENLARKHAFYTGPSVVKLGPGCCRGDDG